LAQQAVGILVAAALGSPWILDIDTTIKTLYGRQSGAEVGYNPHKPGRPSHSLHTYFVSNLRMVLDVVVCSGKQHSAMHARPGLIAVLDSLSKQQLPALVRGDCGFGNDPFIIELEDRSQPYLFKLRQTSGVKRMLARQFARQDWTMPGVRDQGWSAVEDTLRLTGWEKPRRVVILRRAAKSNLALSRKVPEGQIELLLPGEDTELWEYAVLVTNSSYPLDAMAQLYRDRADAENGFDELKNQWGWGGFTTQDMERCQTSARAVALVYNWWSWYCRAAKPGARMEAHQPCVAAGRRWQGDQTCWKDNALSDADARCQEESATADRQCPQGSALCEISCGAVPCGRSMEDTAGLCRSHNFPTPTTKTHQLKCKLGQITAGFRMKTTAYTTSPCNIIPGL
jgi:hypothetical protein